MEDLGEASMVLKIIKLKSSSAVLRVFLLVQLYRSISGQDKISMDAPCKCVRNVLNGTGKINKWWYWRECIAFQGIDYFFMQVSPNSAELRFHLSNILFRLLYYWCYTWAVSTHSFRDCEAPVVSSEIIPVRVFIILYVKKEKQQASYTIEGMDANPERQPLHLT